MPDPGSPSAAPAVKVGQVWADNDWRSKGRTVTVLDIVGVKALCSVAMNGKPTGKKSAILLRRFRPNSTGYRLVKDV